MEKRDSDETRPAGETRQRLRAILKGAFAGSPTPLKEVPTRHGKKRRIRRKASG